MNSEKEKELIEGLRVAYDHLIMNNKTHTRTYKIVKDLLEKYDK